MQIDYKKLGFTLLILLVGCSAILILVENPLYSRTAFLALLCLSLWLTELIPLYATTFLLLAGIPLFLDTIDSRFALNEVLYWPANPVIPLFFGGFTLSVAGRKYGIDAYIGRLLLKLSRGNCSALLAVILSGTAILSMWMSNIAAAAMMIVVLRPLWKDLDLSYGLRKAALLSLAFGANFGGMATPIGSGPNGIALGILNQNLQITFFQWMFFALPLTSGMLVSTFVLLRWIYNVRGRIELPEISIVPLSRSGYAVIVLFSATVLFWLLEPLHGQPAALIALAAAAILFGSGLLKKEDLANIDWATLILIAGGLTLGELIDRSGLAMILSRSIEWQQLPHFLMLFCFVFVVAFLSAIASNTAASVLLIPIAMSIHHAPHVVILIAIGASLGAPFVISTPPNALAYGEGGLKPNDFLLPGAILMVIGCIIVSTTGPAVLRWAGIP